MKQPNNMLVWTGTENQLAAMAAALAPYEAQGCTIIHEPWQRGLYRVAVLLPRGTDDDLRAEIGAEAWRAGVAFYESHAG